MTTGGIRDADGSGRQHDEPVPLRYVPPQVAVDAAVGIVRQRPGGTVFLGVDGCGGSGKSTLAARLAAALPGAVVVCCDDFVGPETSEWEWPRFLDQVARPLLAGRPGRYQDWAWGEPQGGAWHDVPVGQPVVVEGVSSTRPEVTLPWALTVWVEAPREVRLDRALERDGPDLLPQWVDEWMPSEDAYVARERPQRRADLLVSGLIDAVTVDTVGGRRLARVGERVVGVWDGPGSPPVVEPAYQGHGVEQALLG